MYKFLLSPFLFFCLFQPLSLKAGLQETEIGSAHFTFVERDVLPLTNKTEAPLGVQLLEIILKGDPSSQTIHLSLQESNPKSPLKKWIKDTKPNDYGIKADLGERILLITHVDNSSFLISFVTLLFKKMKRDPAEISRIARRILQVQSILSKLEPPKGTQSYAEVISNFLDDISVHNFERAKGKYPKNEVIGKDRKTAVRNSIISANRLQGDWVLIGINSESEQEARYNLLSPLLTSDPSLVVNSIHQSRRIKTTPRCKLSIAQSGFVVREYGPRGGLREEIPGRIEYDLYKNSYKLKMTRKDGKAEERCYHGYQGFMKMIGVDLPEIPHSDGKTEFLYDFSFDEDRNLILREKLDPDKYAPEGEMKETFRTLIFEKR